MSCSEAVRFDIDDSVCEVNAHSRASSGAVKGWMTDSQYHEQITPEYACFTSSQMQTTSPMTTTIPKAVQASHSHGVVLLNHHGGSSDYLRWTSPTNKKSRSIKIKQIRSSDEFDSSAFNEHEYGWATWRMYHRIASSRRTGSNTTVPQMDELSSDTVPSSSFPQEVMGDYATLDSLAAAHDASDDGGVFVMDL